MATVPCALYDDSVDGNPLSCARDGVPRMESYRDEHPIVGGGGSPGARSNSA
jgi:hypothetical protein